MPAHTRCRICAQSLPEPFLDLGRMPLANAFLASPQEFLQETAFPLAVAACRACGLVQLTHVVPGDELYRHYLYVSSTSETVRRYADTLAARLVEALRLTATDLVVELGSNDGLALAAFQRRGVRVLGVEPARNVAAIARADGVPTVEAFFSRATARQLAADHGRASLILARHVFAHIDDWHDFMEGIEAWLAPEGALMIEVPYLGEMIERLEFDTIYHEHLSYLSLGPIRRLAQQHHVQLVDVEPVPLHGGSVLLVLRRQGQESARLVEMLRREQARRLTDPEELLRFAHRVHAWKQAFEDGMDALIGSDASVMGYGAAAKANTLLNYCPSVARRLRGILDRNPLKHGLFTPGTHLQVSDPDRWNPNGTTHLLILAWNFKEEIMAQMRAFTGRGGRFVVPIPCMEII